MIFSHTKNNTTWWIGLVGVIVCLALLIGGIVVLVRRPPQEQSIVVSPQGEQVAEQYERAIREMQMQLQQDDRSDAVLYREVERFLLSVRVPREQLQRHLSSTIAFRSSRYEGADREALIDFLETLIRE